MRRTLFLALTLALAVLAGSLSAPRAEAGGGGFSCPICTTYADGSRCCVSCWCDEYGHIVACTNHYCPPAD
jgi:hypothetical protein